MAVRCLRLGVVALLLCALSLAFAPQVRAQDEGDTTITIHKAECPADYDGDDLFGDCHDDRLEGVLFGFSVGAPEDRQTARTDGDGVAVFDTSAAFTGVSVVESPPYDLAEYVVDCFLEDLSADVPFEYLDDQVGISFDAGTLTGGESVICDWYNIPVASGDITLDPAPTDDDVAEEDELETVTTLPSTGIGAAGTPGANAAAGLLFALVALGSVGLALGVRLRPSR